jgi:glycosyltransferase involved in cell wall biosynthesis
VSVQIVIPARNEEDCIGRCLESLVRQQGMDFSITVVDDGSTDRTRAIAESFAGVRVIGAPDPPPGVSGKCNALIHGTKDATATWILFTDADTFHYPGSLAWAVSEAVEQGADLLSYSPEQETGTWAERALMPLVFADLVRTYPPQRVNDPNDDTVAANGQYLLVRRDVYENLGGHKAIATSILEDVELARLFKASHRRIWFRQGTGLVRTRMYRSFSAMVAGWTKNLALLFRRPLLLAAARGLEFLWIPGFTLVGLLWLVQRDRVAGALSLITSLLSAALFLWRVRAAHFSGSANLASFFGLPLFAWLLVRSWWQAKVRGAVTWKGRIYEQSATHSEAYSEAYFEAYSETRQPADSSIPRSSGIKS